MSASNWKGRGEQTQIIEDFWINLSSLSIHFDTFWLEDILTFLLCLQWRYRRAHMCILVGFRYHQLLHQKISNWKILSQCCKFNLTLETLAQNWTQCQLGTKRCQPRKVQIILLSSEPLWTLWALCTGDMLWNDFQTLTLTESSSV